MMDQESTGFYWPVFLIVAALSTATVWTQAPRLGSSLAESTRAEIRAKVRGVMALVDARYAERAGYEPIYTSLAAPSSAPAPSSSAPSPVAPAPASTPVPPVEPPAVALVGLVDDFESPVRAEDAAPASGVAAVPAAVPADAERLQPGEKAPLALGIDVVDAMDGDWGVLKGVTIVQDRRGKSLGTVAGGRFFVVERRFRTDSGTMLIGNFTPKRLEEPVQIAADDLVAFTGRLNDLSEHQRQCLRSYYELRGEAERFKRDLARTAAEKSPFFRDAAAALKSYRAAVAAFDRTANEDARRKDTYRLAQLRDRVLALNAKHRAWKESHAADFPDPEKNPRYLELVARRARFAPPIAGMIAD